MHKSRGNPSGNNTPSRTGEMASAGRHLGNLDRNPRRWVLLAGLVLVSLVLIASSVLSIVSALLFSVSIGYVILSFPVPTKPSSIERFIQAALLFASLVGLILPACIGLTFSTSRILSWISEANYGQNFSICMTSIFVFSGIVLLSLRWPRNEIAFLLLTVPFFAILKLAYIYYFANIPESDFATMWALTEEVSEHGLDSVELDIMLQRILPYLLPLRLLFGPEPTSYSIANIGTILLSAGCAYYFSREWFGKAAARVTIVMALMAIEPTLAAAIPTHDIPGTGLALVSLFLFHQSYKRLVAERVPSAWVFSALTGLAISVFDLQRNHGAVLLFSCAVLTLACCLSPSERLRVTQGRDQFRKRARFVFVLFLVPLLMTEIVGLALRRADLAMPTEMTEEQVGIVLACFTDSWGDGGWQDCYDNYISRYSSKGSGVFLELAKVKLISDLYYNLDERPGNYIRKSRELYDLGSQLYFYLPSAKVRSVGPLGREHITRISTLR